MNEVLNVEESQRHTRRVLEARAERERARKANVIAANEADQRQAKRDAWFVDFVTTHPGCTVEDVSRVLQWWHTKVRSALDYLALEGRVIEQHGRWYSVASLAGNDER